MKRITVKELSVMAILLTMLIICSKMSFTLSTSVTYTLQTLAISFICLYLDLKKTLLIVLTYILMGLVGIPVFATGGGISYITSPTFGFIIGFFLFTITFKVLNKYNIFIKMISLIPLYICGAIYMHIIFKYYLEVDKTIIYIIQISILPYIVKDILSILLSNIIYKRKKTDSIQ